MKLFDDFERTYTGRANHDHSSYDFINSSTWPAAVYVRALLTEWSKQFPLDSDFVSRFRSDNYQKHLAAFFEIAIYMWLRKQNYNVVLHEIASQASQKRPDFCISMALEKRFYAECTLSALPDYEPGIERLKNQITDVLENIDSGKYCLVVDFEKCNTVSLPKKKLTNFVAQIINEGLPWEDDSNWDKKAWTLRESGWQIRFKIFPKPKGASRTVGMIHGGPAGIIHSEKPLRSALDRKKGSSYGNLEHPYIICVNSCDFYLDTLSVMQTLFGSWSQQTRFSLKQKETDGFLLYNGKPLNTSVSAVLIVNNLVPWNIHVAKAMLWHNPFAAFPLNDETLNIPQTFFRTVDGNTFEAEQTQGKLIGQVLNVDPNYMDSDVE